MVADGIAEAFAHRSREVAIQLCRKVRIFRYVGLNQLVVQHDLAVRNENSQLRTSQALSRLAPLGEAFFVGQEFDRAIQLTASLHTAHETLQLGQTARRLQLQSANRLALQIIVAQDQRGNFVGHARQEPIPVAPFDAARALLGVEQNLQIHLNVGGIDSGRIIDEIGIDAAAGLRVFDTPALGESEIATFADDFGAHFATVDPHGIIAAVADVDGGFRARFDVSADATVPQQIDLHPQDRAHYVVGRCGGGTEAKHFLGFAA